MKQGEPRSKMAPVFGRQIEMDYANLKTCTNIFVVSIKDRGPVTI